MPREDQTGHSPVYSSLSAWLWCAVTIRAIVLCCVFLVSARLYAQRNTDVIVMKNGDRFTCEIKGLSAGVLSVKVKYVDGDMAVQWSEVAHLESNRLFLVHTESGAAYTGKISTSGASNDPPIRIEIAETPGKEVEVAQHEVIKLNQTSDGFWQRFVGAVNTGLLYSKGNESTQYNISSQVAYNRERWSSELLFNSSLASNSGSTLSTRNQTDLDTLRLLRWNNWFYAGTASFLQSSVQAINLQTTLGAGVGRYLKNTNRASIYVLGGLGWQNVGYGQNTGDHGAQNTAVGFVASQVKLFKFKKTNLDVSASCCRRSQKPDVFISIPMRSITSKLSRISRGTSRSTGAGIADLLQHSPRATTAPVQALVGPSVIDDGYLIFYCYG